MAERRKYTPEELTFYDEGYFSEEELQEFATSKDGMERRVAAEHGLALDKLMNDPIWEVRRAVAERGYGLDVLVNDEVEWVRREVAFHGRYLDKLLEDESEQVRAAVAEYGYRTDLLVNDESDLVRAAVAVHGDYLDKLVDDPSSYVRSKVAIKGYGLEKLVNDEDWIVRYEVARQDFGLSVLVDDPYPRVRVEVARQGYGLDKLVYDESKLVRLAVAREGYGFDVLVNDPDREVSGIARTGIGFGFAEASEVLDKVLAQKAHEWALGHPNRCAVRANRNREVPSLVDFFNEQAHAMLLDAVQKVADAARLNYGGVAGLDDNLVNAITEEIADRVEQGLRENTAIENAAHTANAISHARAMSYGLYDKLIAEEQSRKPGELKSAGEKPKQPREEKVSPGSDEAVAKKSAAARGVDGRESEKTRKK